MSQKVQLDGQGIFQMQINAQEWLCIKEN